MLSLQIIVMLTKEEGNFLLKLAREVIEKSTRREVAGKPKKYSPSLDKECGVFCTITQGDELRGCIGIPYPIMPLINAVISAAHSAATEDYRFEPITREELNKIKIEISVLTTPKLIYVEKPEQYLEKIKIGEDGLIIEYGPYSGLLLPQVAVEYNWTPQQFLENLCLKAGLSPGMWKTPDVKIYKFQAQIFKEP